MKGTGGIRRNFGFTLVELIVVITILAILATIGFLSLSGYSDDARNSAIKANVRSVLTAISAESAVTGNSPRYYVVHDTGAALSGAFVYVDGAQTFLTWGDWNVAGTNYSAGNPDYVKLKINSLKFKVSFVPVRNFIPESFATYDSRYLVVWALDMTQSSANGAKRPISWYQVAGISPSSNVASVVGNFPTTLSGSVGGLIKDLASASATWALADGKTSSNSSSSDTTLAGPASCFAIKTATPSSPDGVYSIDPDGNGGNPSFQAYCDMTRDWGGWTMVVGISGSTKSHVATWAVNASGLTSTSSFGKFADTVIRSIYTSHYKLELNGNYQYYTTNSFDATRGTSDYGDLKWSSNCAIGWTYVSIGWLSSHQGLGGYPTIGCNAYMVYGSATAWNWGHAGWWGVNGILWAK